LRVNIHHQVELLEQRINNAKENVAGMKNFPGIVQKAPPAFNGLQSGLDTFDSTISPLIAPLKMFNSIANEIANVLGVYLCPVID